jgi:hypothetical protein
MPWRNEYMIKKYFILCIALAIASMIFVYPHRSNAIIVVDLEAAARDAVKILAQKAIRSAIRVALQTTVDQIRNTILHPGDGNNGPAYITNWRSYLQEVEIQGTVAGEQLAGLAIYGASGTTNQGTVCGYLQQQVGYMVGARQPDPAIVPSLAKYQNQGVDFKNTVGCTAPKTVTLPDGTQAPMDVQKYINGEPGYFSWSNYDTFGQGPNLAIPLALQTNEMIEQNIENQKTVKLQQGVADQGFRPLVNVYDIAKSPGSYVANAANATVNTELNCLVNINVDFNVGSILSTMESCLLDGLDKNLKDFSGFGITGPPAPGATPTPTPPTFIPWSAAKCDQVCTDFANQQCQNGVITDITKCMQNARFQCYTQLAIDGCKL